MSKQKITNYYGEAAKWLAENNIKVWMKVSLKSTKGSFEGILIPRGEQGDDQHIVIKLTSGYNIGLNIKNISEIKSTGEVIDNPTILDKKPQKNPEKPNVVLFGTGGTVASKLDYKTGAVTPAFTPQELFNAIPELHNIANLDTKEIFKIFSENITPKHWITLANEITTYVERANPNGIVVAHGTDTLHFTSAALSFIFKNLDRPIVFVGSQRSSDRPSSDAAINLIDGVNVAANSNIAEVIVCMHGSSGDIYNVIHRGTRVRKMHSSRRDAFKTIGDKPLGKIVNGKIHYSGIEYNKRPHKSVELEIDTELNDNVGLVYSYPGIKSDLLNFFIDKGYNGLVIAGTGLGHISTNMIDIFKRAYEEKIPIFMTSQCLWGYTGMNVYETGRLLLKEGIIPLSNMLPEVALVKAMWVLGHTDEIPFVKELMQKNLAGEITERETFDGFYIHQSGMDKRFDKLLEKEK